jgi:hypothetical protein
MNGDTGDAMKLFLKGLCSVLFAALLLAGCTELLLPDQDLRVQTVTIIKIHY